MANQFTEYELESTPVVVPPPTKGKGSLLTVAIEKLCAGQVGDSFIAKHQPSQIAWMARMKGVKIISRCITPNEREYKKRAYRVWRSDGHDMDTLNKIIQKRLAGEKVETLPLEPPPADYLQAIRDKKHPKK